MPLPEQCDSRKVAEVALALLALTKHGSAGAPRVWKGLDWGILDLLHKNGWITDPRTKAKSVLLTEQGEELASGFIDEHLGRDKPSQEPQVTGSDPDRT